MLIDTHCHINMMVKTTFDTPLQEQDIIAAKDIVSDAYENNVRIIINVGTREIENHNCIILAQTFNSVYATVGIHPNDSDEWQHDLKKMQQWLKNRNRSSFAKASEDYRKIVGIGECGMDKHYPGYNLNRQRDAFKAQIELALEHDLALVVHSRDAYDETLRILEEYRNNIQRATMHCFAYDQYFADLVTSWGFVLGIGGTLTYPKNEELRSIVKKSDIKHIVLETDAPFLPIQAMRGKQNRPQYIKDIAEYIAQLRNESFDYIAQETTNNALQLFNLHAN